MSEWRDALIPKVADAMHVELQKGHKLSLEALAITAIDTVLREMEPPF